MAHGSELEREITAVGWTLNECIALLVRAIPDAGSGPVALAQALGLDKVLTSRVLKALRQQDGVASMYFMPGPEPLRSLLRAAQKRGVPADTAQAAASAIGAYERLIDNTVGDRSLLDSILSAWIPEARAEFELRRKQAAFKALSQLKGAMAESVIATCLIAPSADPALMDVVWVHGLTGLHRVRPGVVVKLASRRMSAEPSARRAQRLDGALIDELSPPMVAEFCSSPTPRVDVRRVKESLFYTLGGDGFGAGSAVDIAFVEINRAELKRPAPLTPEQRERGEARGAYFFAEAAVPAKNLQFDLIVHDALFPGQDPVLRIHDTAFDGVADVFDQCRELDRMDLLESIIPLGRGLTRVRSGAVPRYSELLGRVIHVLGHPSETFRSYRCVVEYPLYGSQTSMVFPNLT